MIGDFTMEKLKKFILKNKLLSVLIFLFVLIIILGLVIIKCFVFPSYKVSKYGNRLDGISDVKLSDSRFDEIKDSFDAVDGFTIDGFRLSGRIVNIYISANESIDVDKVKSSCSKLVNKFSDEELKFYDFQVFVTGPDDSKYPILGYKNKNSEGLSWNYEGGK